MPRSTNVGFAETGQSSDQAHQRRLIEALTREIMRLSEATLQSVDFMRAQHGTAMNYWQLPACSAPLGLPAAHAQSSAAVRALDRLRTFKRWRANWDAEGAPAPDLAALDAAMKLLGHLKTYPIDPTAMLDTTGHPLLLLRYEGGEGEISILAENILDFVLQIPGEDTEVEADLAFDPETIPASLDVALRRLQALDPA